ncbi:MAG: hypothetical protein JWO78_829 [Micavibrio sp.]|nr:hypothetical protein [Micavibrio sp.]
MPFERADVITEFLETAANAIDILTVEDLAELGSNLHAIANAFRKRPGLVTDETLEGLSHLAMKGESQDCMHHIPTPRDRACLTVIGVLADAVLMTRDIDGGRRALGHLDALISDCQDWNIRSEAATYCAHVLGGYTGGTADPLIIALLEKQGRENSDHHIRTKARDGLISLARDRPAIIRHAMDAQIFGTEDANPQSRAFAMLNNRVNAKTVRTKKCRD